MKRVVIKIGTQVIVNESGFQLKVDVLEKLMELIVRIHNMGIQVVLVSSGAVALGRAEMQLTGSLSLSEKQACAAIGQARLIQTYDRLLQEHKVTCAQVLVTAEDLASRRSYLHLKDTFSSLLDWGVVPIINENDSVSTAELEDFEGKSFGDNDVLCALIATKLNANLMILLTSVDGIYRQQPKVGEVSERLGLVNDVQSLSQIEVSGKTSLGRGGMQAKLEAVRLAALCGVSSWVGQLDLISSYSGEWGPEHFDTMAKYATLVTPSPSLRGRKRWIGGSAGYKGVLTINQGASEAIMARGASLLVVGAVAVSGDFLAGDIVSVRDELGRELGRGLVRFGSTDLNVLLNQIRTNAQSIGERQPTGERRKQIAIHRDDLALFVKS